MGSFLETYIDPETSVTGVDGCALNNLKCEQRCDFSVQGYRCSCSRGYRLAENKQDCIGKKIEISCSELPCSKRRTSPWILSRHSLPDFSIRSHL